MQRAICLSRVHHQMQLNQKQRALMSLQRNRASCRTLLVQTFILIILVQIGQAQVTSIVRKSLPAALSINREYVLIITSIPRVLKFY